LPKLPKEK